MKYTQGSYPIIEKTSLAKEVFSYVIHCPEIADVAEMGQFVNVFIKGHTLRRPISICEIDKEKGNIRIVFEVRGHGTKEISDFQKDSMIDIMGPLGRGWRLNSYKSAVIIGGGIGTPPMVPLAQYFGKNCTVITGFRSAPNVILQDDFKITGADVVLCTDDGSYGRKGYVTEALTDVLKNKTPDIIYACGPNVMIKRIVDTAKEKSIPCQISLEERMGCGIGACLVCACRTVRNGEEFYAHVCQDGPVFKAEEVIF